MAQKARDLTGIRYGRWLVIKRHGSDSGKYATWLCLCDCGNTGIVRSSHLTSGESKSCGCLANELSAVRAKNTPYRRIDLSNCVFGRLTVISFVSGGTDDQARWLCNCECGNETIVVASNLRNGNTQSCGCLHKEITAARMTTHGQYFTKEYACQQVRKRKEKKKNLDINWSLDQEHALVDFFPVCVVCGDTYRLATDHVYPLSKGYGLSVGNAVRLCNHCNSSKGNKLPNDLPEPMRSLILEAAEAFRMYWEETHP